jgi:hypothetical protein
LTPAEGSKCRERDRKTADLAYEGTSYIVSTAGDVARFYEAS